jgi:hypothetical protein
MNDQTNLPAIPEDYAAALMTGIAESKASTIVAGGGKDLLRMLKSGEWVFGQSNEEVQPGSRWVANVMSFQHGWCCWVEGGPGQKNELRGEIMVSMAKPKPACPPPIDGTPYKEQRVMDLKCLDGADAGTEVTHKVGSIGGMRAILDLLDKVRARLASNPRYSCPVLVLGTDHYDHNKWGRIYTPVLEVVGWADMNGNLEGAPVPQVSAQSSPEATPTRPRVRKPPVDAAAAPVEPVAPVSTTQAHVGQRRRPAAR